MTEPTPPAEGLNPNIYRPADASGCVHVYTGDGKGKTTAAVGLLTRAAGADLPAIFIQFDKGFAAADYYCEHGPLKKLGVEIVTTGAQRMHASGRFRFKNQEEDFAEAKRALSVAREAIEGDKFDLIVLDEIVASVQTDLISEDDVMALLALHAEHPRSELILTGRGAWPALCTRADLVTEMKMHRHPFEQGIALRRGIDH